MNSNQKIARITGILFLLIFVIGVTIFQFLQSSLFADDFLTVIFANANKIIGSTLLNILNGVVSIVVAILLLPIFKKYSMRLAFAYLAFCIVYFIAMFADNISVLSLLDLSQAYMKNGSVATDSFELMGNLLYERHSWTHYTSLLISCLPAFVLFYILYISKLIPKVISIFGMFAVLLMSVEIVCSLYGHGISMNMMLPIALVQLILPIWLLIKGFKTQTA